jgi:hypothetical protein
MPTTYTKTSPEKIQDIASVLSEAVGLFVEALENARKENLVDVYIPITYSSYKSVQGVLKLAELTSQAVRQQVREKKLGISSAIEVNKRRNKSAVKGGKKKATKTEETGGEK